MTTYRRSPSHKTSLGFTTTYAISAYHHQRCEFKPRLWRGVLDAAVCDKVCQWLSTDRWFSPVSSTNITDRNDITEILLKVALITINQTNRTSVQPIQMHTFVKQIGMCVVIVCEMLSWIILHNESNLIMTSITDLFALGYLRRNVQGCKHQVHW